MGFFVFTFKNSIFKYKIKITSVMSRTKDLKSLPENNINLFKVFSSFVPEGKSKYTETLLRIIKKTPYIDEEYEHLVDTLSIDLGINPQILNKLGKLELLLSYQIIRMFNLDDLKTFIKFCEYNERGLIKQNDLSRYNNFDDIKNSLSVAELSGYKKDLEKQIKIVYEDEEWILLRPLTFSSSKKYGSNTKWCTTSDSHPNYFYKYAEKGVLIYSINKITGYKVASFYSLDKYESEFSFWNQKDVRIDSLETELNSELLNIISRESKDPNAVTNYSLLSEEEKKKDNEFMKNNSKSLPLMDPSNERNDELTNNYMRRAINRAVNELGDNRINRENLNNHISEVQESVDVWTDGWVTNDTTNL